MSLLRSYILPATSRLHSFTLAHPATRTSQLRCFTNQQVPPEQLLKYLQSGSAPPIDMSAITDVDQQQKIAALQAERAQQDDKVQQLRAANTEQSTLKAEIGKLKKLEAQLVALGLGGAKAGSSKQEVKFTLKTPKGTRDWEPLAMSVRKRIFSTIEDVFTAHGAVTIDTPVFELKEILSGKYGEDSKLIYDLQDQGGELCSLRYDLTVPFARFVAMNPSEYGNIKRYHIAKVYRRDQPAMSKGRFREFYQCDLDIAGVYDAMVPDSEVLCTLVEALDALGIEGFTIKINHRKILDGLFDICGVPADKIRTISSAVDKLDKSPWAEVKREMVVDKGLAEDVADRIGEYVKLKGGRDLLAKLKQDAVMTGHPVASQGVKDMELLFDYLDVYGITDRMSFDLSLARGLDYYTGLIYEAVTAASAPPGFNAAAEGDKADKKSKKPKKGADGEDEVDESAVGVGSIAAGGRYDNLVGMFSGSKKPDVVPCVGVSIGVERVFAIMMQRLKEKEAKGERSSVRAKEVDVYVMSIGGEGLLKERMQVAKMLWDAGIKAEFMHKAKPKLPQQFAVVDKESIPFAVILAPSEWGAGEVRVKQQKGKDSDEGQGQGHVVKVDQLIEYLKGLGAGQGAVALGDRQSLI
ncbi:probable HTS1-histidine--tRNA ligase, mitochondrial [Sporisorium reilianum f. sp. reilianum]|uniref:Histidine--tRNA ligase, mitochondrial n=1 Tax=Sporisorium reilianum f. sp. reilianum TaxID=72559 RepID=A0A2N8UN78_9BASI|nr:probable HTS1-histidine--tRNA ligase, mitochondrial [Sporisorium reilianum f. sp. reilianum]